MPEYSLSPVTIIDDLDGKIPSFITGVEDQIDKHTVASFGMEWQKFDQFSECDIETIGNEYFDIVDPHLLAGVENALDIGCGSGRWSRFLASKVDFVEAIDPSSSIITAKKNYSEIQNIRWTRASVGSIPFNDSSFEFIMCLGVLHHVPDTALAIKQSVQKLKPGGHILLYLYYALETRSRVHKLLFRISSVIRYVVSKLPHRLKAICCDLLALVAYIPLIMLARGVRSIITGNSYKAFPLSYYVNKSFHVIRNDTLDRFGTPLEQRFTKSQIRSMMEEAGLVDLIFSDSEPYWHVLGKKPDA